MVGLDVTTSMVRAARAKLGHRAPIVQADLAQPLPFRDASFHLALSAFTLHYLRDWSGVLGEVHRILRPDGALVLSVHHPFNDLSFSARRAYFETEAATDVWTASDGRPAEVHFYRRPLSAIVKSLHQANLVVERLLEAPPSWAEDHPNPELMPWFLCIRALKREAAL